MFYTPPFAKEFLLTDNTTMTVTTYSSFTYYTFPDDEVEVNSETNTTTTLQVRFADGVVTGAVPVSVTGEYGNTVFLGDNAYGRPGANSYPSGVTVMSVVSERIDNLVLTNGFDGGKFWYANITQHHVGAPGYESLTAPSVLDFFCGRGLITVLIYLSKQSVACPVVGNSRTAYRPNKSDIAGGALQDIGARGFSFAGSPAKFYARWGNKEKRKQAGFSYNFDTFALRTDYNKLPAAQDAKVMLDTYRVGIMPDIGKRHRLFAGVDNYRNGIFAIQYSDVADTNTHTNIYKLGSVAGKGGYAVKFEWRIVWE